MTTYEKIKELCENAGFSISSISKKIPGLSINKASITGWKNGSKPRPDKIKAIADYFGVTVEYLTNDEEVSVQTVQDNHGIIGHTHAPVTIINGSEKKLTEQELALLEIFSKLDVVKQAQLLAYAADLAK
ncbi:MAG: helix-turn-helix transcriptional regulator [Ruminococcus sp.]|nr:helix-turn-helix transcriptional regulator [Ruminococcus sp.]MBQ8571921.1 helix-turn-helix transcriptional regulator [Ruminococcus sp.]